MKTLDEGHKYALATLDGDGSPETLTFVKRMGDKYPGNESAYSGTTLQEVLRACLDRVYYLDNQQPGQENVEVIKALVMAVTQLEARAARKHNRRAPPPGKALYGELCGKCLHVGCVGKCHE